MKRIPWKIAVASILSTMTPQTEVQIVDVPMHLYTSEEDFAHITSAQGVTHTVDELLHDYRLTRLCNAEVRRVAVTISNVVGENANDVKEVPRLVIVIDTSHEEY